MLAKYLILSYRGCNFFQGLDNVKTNTKSVQCISIDLAYSVC